MIAYEAAHGAIGRLRRLGATARLFEAAVQQHIIQPQTLGVSFIRISGLTLEHCANGFMRSGVAALFTMGGHHWIIEGNTVRQVDSVGIDAGGRGSVRHQTAGLPRNPGAEQSRCAHPGRRCHLIWLDFGNQNSRVWPIRTTPSSRTTSSRAFPKSWWRPRWPPIVP